MDPKPKLDDAFGYFTWAGLFTALALYTTDFPGSTKAAKVVTGASLALLAYNRWSKPGEP